MILFNMNKDVKSFLMKPNSDSKVSLLEYYSVNEVMKYGDNILGEMNIFW